MAKIGSSQPPASPLGGRRIGSAAAGDPAPAAETPVQQPTATTTLAQRLASATLAGGLTKVPETYDDGHNGNDWQTLLDDDVFTQLYLAAPLYAQITDAQVAANKTVLENFWQAKLRRLTTGDRELEEIYRPGTVKQAQARLDAAAAALATATGRAACFTELDRRRRAAATAHLERYIRPQLLNKIMRPEAIRLAVEEGEKAGFTLAEAEQYVPDYLRQAGFSPIRTANQGPNLLLAIWTEGGQPLADQPHTNVLGQKVYSLTEAGQVLYAALSGAERDKAVRNLDSVDYLENIAKDLKENDVQLDLREIFQNRQLTQPQRQLTALYLLGPGLPFRLEGLPEFTNPAQLLARTAASAKEFGVAEAAFTAGLLPIWLRAAAAPTVRAALPATGQVLGFRQFLHRAAPGFPLWVGEQSFSTTSELAAYIRRDENTWKMVYGSLIAGNLSPWLAAQGNAAVLTRQAQRAEELRGPGVDPNSEPGRQLAVQALLEVLDPLTDPPRLEPDLNSVDLTDLSGETQATRTLTITNQTGGPVRVYLELKPALEGVSLSTTGLYFDQRAPGQKLLVTLSGNPALMPRDGQHTAQLVVRTAYAACQIPARAEAVFPTKQFLQFVGGSALALAVIFGVVRWLLGLLLSGGTYDSMAEHGALLPLSQAARAGHDSGFVLAGALLLLLGLVYWFGRTLAKLAKAKPTA
ncbi:MAG: hypothetical protein ACRYFX_06050 [Janthinobacterium lividum]